MHIDINMKKLSKILNLQRLMLILAIMSTMIAITGSIFSSYNARKQTIIESTLEYNRLYAAKLADTADMFINSSQDIIGYSSNIIGLNFSNNDVVSGELKRLQMQTQNFSAAIAIDNMGMLKAIWPESKNLLGQQVDMDGIRDALRNRSPSVSSPFVAASGDLVIFISHPIVGPNGDYLGCVGVTIPLHTNNVLSTLLGAHPYKDGSYLYVVDRSRRLLYHPDANRIGETVGVNRMLDRVLTGESGAQPVINSRGVAMLAGYAAMPTVGWGIVAQRPRAAALQVLDDWLFNLARSALPLIAVSIAGIWWMSRLIARPLWRLAKIARQLDKPGVTGEISGVSAWYYEAAQLKGALLTGSGLVNHKIDQLSQDVLTDPLTGLYNRRGMEIGLNSLRDTQTPFSVVTLDIDHFKHVNDQYGHPAGDRVLETLAGHLSGGARDNDAICRVGGEEFLILLPNTDLAQASQIAERLRRRVAESAMPVPEAVTISLGVAHWPTDNADVYETIRLADERLYMAKNSGRNRVVTASTRAPLKIA